MVTRPLHPLLPTWNRLPASLLHPPPSGSPFRRLFLGGASLLIAGTQNIRCLSPRSPASHISLGQVLTCVVPHRTQTPERGQGSRLVHPVTSTLCRITNYQSDRQEPGIFSPSVPHSSTEQAPVKGWQKRAGLLSQDPRGGWETGLFFPWGAPGTGMDGHGRRSLKAAVAGLGQPRRPQSSAPASKGNPGCYRARELGERGPPLPLAIQTSAAKR